jgi:hypothetical protein
MTKSRRPPIQKVTLEDKLASKKLADRYVRRDGGRPSIVDAVKAGRFQDLNEDDRKHIRFCLKTISRKLGVPPSEAHDALEFVVLLLDRDYKLYKETV